MAHGKCSKCVRKLHATNNTYYKLEASGRDCWNLGVVAEKDLRSVDSVERGYSGSDFD